MTRGRGVALLSALAFLWWAKKRYEVEVEIGDPEVVDWNPDAP